MPDYPIPPGNPPLLAGPQFPFSRALTSGPIGELLAGLAGAPGDFQNLMQPRPISGIPSAGSLAPAQLPTMEMISRAQEQQNARSVAPTYQGMYSIMPDLLAGLAGQQMMNHAPPWLTNVLGAPSQQTPASSPASNPQQGWNLEKMFFDLIGGAKPAYGAVDDGLPEVDRNASRGPSGPHPQAR
jgi:hypothetical protein